MRSTLLTLTVMLLAASAGAEHPRLFFSAEDIGDLRARAETTHARQAQMVMTAANNRMDLEILGRARRVELTRDGRDQPWRLANPSGQTAGDTPCAGR